MEMVDVGDLISVGEMAALVGEPKHRISYLLDSGRLRAVCRVGGRRLLLRKQVSTVAALLEAPGQQVVSSEGGDDEILTIEEAAQVLEVEPAEVRRVVHGGGVSPASVVGGRPPVTRGQLREIKRLLEGPGRRPRGDVLEKETGGPGLVRGKAAEPSREGDRG